MPGLCAVQKAVAEKGTSGSRGRARGEEWRMTQPGAILQGYNNELVKYIEDLCLQKEELNKQIQQAEEEKNKLQHEIQTLNEQLEHVCENLDQKIALRNDLSKILNEAETAYMKILDSSRTLLNVLKKEVGDLKHTPELKSNVT
ncbi:microtubule nucleation factor SSNA1-like isoform X1 [Cygnus atratus]|uniref:microtubule nucleation factor SSNA1-like isoform X1 n=2 Tax=Cygnus atratus TaxID=8868 RepID=UPI0015D60B9C|nr:microtubule nucleation factor SSNA1-like isoform X1 [Cygnus atratus]